MENKPKKLKDLTEKQKIFIESYRKHAGNATNVCSELNIGIVSFNKYLRQPSVIEQLNKSLQISREKIQAAMPYLIDKAISMVNDENVSDRTKSTLISSLLDRGGLVQPKAPAVQINLNTEISDRARQLLAQKVESVNPTGIPIDPVVEI